ncbi:MAG TPA: response regulator transcription factor [Gemmatimonadaceae bacterium]|nr:response regulator transcription factor [Gemmatimonadaceae bacterium]
MRVLVVAESPVVRAGLESILVRESDVTVVGGTSADDTLAQQIEEHDPDVVLLELGPDDEPDVARPVLVSAPAGARTPAVVVIAQAPDGPLVAAALRSGARVVLSREASGEEIVAAARAAAAGLAAFPSALMDDVLRPAAPSAARESGAAPDAELSPREMEVLRMLAEGLGNKQIAARLGVSEHTVKFHLGSIFQKLHASTRTEAVTIGLRRGLLLL